MRSFPERGNGVPWEGSRITMVAQDAAVG
jgi:hypothetical protein